MLVSSSSVGLRLVMQTDSVRISSEPQGTASHPSCFMGVYSTDSDTTFSWWGCDTDVVGTPTAYLFEKDGDSSPAATTSSLFSNVSKGIIIGASVGGALLIITFTALICLCKRRWSR